MKFKIVKRIIVLLILSMIVRLTFSQTDKLSADYLNQETPDNIPKIFASGFITKKGYYQYPCSFSSDMTEMYYGVNIFLDKEKEKYILCVKRKEDGSWMLPERISFTGFDESEPILSPDNSKLFFLFVQI